MRARSVRFCSAAPRLTHRRRACHFSLRGLNVREWMGPLRLTLLSGPCCVYCMKQTSHRISRLLTSKPLAAAGTRGRSGGPPSHSPLIEFACHLKVKATASFPFRFFFFFKEGFSHVTASQDAGQQVAEDPSCMTATTVHVDARRACSAPDTSPPCTYISRRVALTPVTSRASEAHFADGDTPTAPSSLPCVAVYNAHDFSLFGPNG